MLHLFHWKSKLALVQMAGHLPLAVTARQKQGCPWLLGFLFPHWKTVLLWLTLEFFCFSFVVFFCWWWWLFFVCFVFLKSIDTSAACGSIHLQFGEQCFSLKHWKLLCSFMHWSLVLSDDPPFCKGSSSLRSTRHTLYLLLDVTLQQKSQRHPAGILPQKWPRKQATSLGRSYRCRGQMNYRESCEHSQFTRHMQRSSKRSREQVENTFNFHLWSWLA